MSGPDRTPDFAVIGGGILGLTLALEIKRRQGSARVLLLEKEQRLGLHASGRNSGVLHAGFYYSAESLKARFCRDGNRELTIYCQDRGLAINRCGKLVIARNDAELGALDELLQRGRANGVEVEMVSEADARRIEPRARTHGRALWSPTTSSVDAPAVVAALAEDAKAAGIAVQTDTRYLEPARGGIATSRGWISPGYVVNAAGLYADRVAHGFGHGLDYRLLPFKGLYLLGEEGERFRTHLYPVPNLRNPFLGVHITVAVNGRAKLGPTAVPAFWREQYGGLAGFRAGECGEILWREAGLLLSDAFGFRRIAWEEIRKYSRRRLVSMAANLASGIHRSRYRRWGRAGIRAQLLDVRARRLDTDFRWAGDARSFHVLNAVSPAFTCAFPLSRFLVDRIEELSGSGGRRERAAVGGEA